MALAAMLMAAGTVWVNAQATADQSSDQAADQALDQAAGQAAAAAAALEQATGPAEAPPEGFSGTEYVDSQGCAFARARIGDRVTWVPRLDRAREPVCGLEPSGATAAAQGTAETPPAVPETMAKEPEGQAAAETAASETTTPAPSAASAPEGGTVEAGMTETATTGAATPDTTMTKSDSPKVTPEAPATAAAEETTSTRPAKTRSRPVLIERPQVEKPAKVRSAARRTGGQMRTGAQVRAIVPEGPLRLAEERAIDGAATYCPDASRPGRRYLLTDGRRVTACGAPPRAGVAAYLNGLGVPGLVVDPGVASDEAVRRARAIQQSADYRVVWQRGKLGPAPVYTSAPAPATASAPAPAATRMQGAARYVQIGAFGDPANVAKNSARLQGLGLPVRTYPVSGGRLNAVLAGPFASGAETANALTLLRNQGYRDAFARP